LYIPWHIGLNHVLSSKFLLINLESDLIAIGISVILSLGGILALTSGFDDDDDQDGGGNGSPIYEPVIVGSPA